MRLPFIAPLAVLCTMLVCSADASGQQADLALINAKVYPSSTEPAIERAAVVIHDGRIVAVGPGTTIAIPQDAKVLDCTGMVVTAGFWNSHVHFMSPALLHADTVSAARIDAQLHEMLTRWGFTTVFDLASGLANTNVIRRRIERGEVKGPRILTVGDPFWAKSGTPIYVQDYLRTNHINIPEVQSRADAVARVRRHVRDGADGIKLWTGSPEANGVVIMPLDLARAITAEAHRAGKPVFTHPTNREGAEIALESGVDILAHTTTDAPWPASFVERMKAAHMALIPTLTLWHVESRESLEQFEKEMDAIVLPQVRAYSRAGGQILFGTDVGFMDHYDTSEEFQWMSRAGMSFAQILASLTTAPAARFGYGHRSGRIATGMDADLVILGADPQQDVTAFSRVRYTIRGGDVIYSQP